MTNDEVDRAIRACVEPKWGAIHPDAAERAIYRAGVAAGIEAAAKVCEKRPIRSGKVAAAAIRALKDA